MTTVSEYAPTAVLPNIAPASTATASAMLRWAASFAASADLPALLPITAERSWIPLENPAGWDAWLIAWPAGSDTGWHDHQGAAGVFYVGRGVLTEFSLAGGRSAAGAGGANERVATPIASWSDVRTRRIEAGRGRGLGTNHVHHVVNEYDQPAYSVHAYSPRLYGMTRYTWHDDTLVLAGREADTAP